MAKTNIDKNFENLKAQMIKKKDIAKKQEESKKISEQNNYLIMEEQKAVKEDINDRAPKIIIKKQEKADVPKRITYYLNSSTIKKIDKYSNMAGMGKSAFVQTLLDLALDNLEIE